MNQRGVECGVACPCTAVHRVLQLQLQLPGWFQELKDRPGTGVGLLPYEEA